VKTEFRSGDALFVFDEERTILSWNPVAEELTGIAASEAVGKPCWDVLGGVDERGSLVCHPGCSGARLAGEGWPVKCQRLLVKTAAGTRRGVWVSTIACTRGDQPAHPPSTTARGAVDEEEIEPTRPTQLTRRQLECSADRPGLLGEDNRRAAPDRGSTVRATSARSCSSSAASARGLRPRAACTCSSSSRA
jgi:PAS domain S-box-containing protein